MEPIDHNLFPKIQLIELHQIGLICLYSELIFQFHHCPVIYTLNLDLSLFSLFLLSFFQNSSLPSFPFSIPRSLSPSPFLPRTRARTHPHSVTHTHTHTHTHTVTQKFEEMTIWGNDCLSDCFTLYTEPFRTDLETFQLHFSWRVSWHTLRHMCWPRMARIRNCSI